MDNGDFGGFLVGNGFYQYSGSHKTMRYVLHDRPCMARVETARIIMQSGLLDHLNKAVRLAYRDTLSYLQRDVFAHHREDLIKQINEYYHAVTHNISFFNAKLITWQPEPTDTSKLKRARTPDPKQGREEDDNTGSHRRE